MPELFLPAIPNVIDYKIELIFITGFLELILGFSLLNSKTLNLASLLCCYYFIALLPVHIYVSFNGIHIFGIEKPSLLWFRTLLQFVLIYMVDSLRSNSWVIEQRWKDVLFLHYKINPQLVQPLVPYPLDLHEGNAIISIVPFQMDKIRFPFLPSAPWFSRLWELNIRTYVEVNGVKGVYFFTLETDSKLGTMIANSFFALPYRYSKIKGKIQAKSYQFHHQRTPFFYSLEAKIQEIRTLTSFDEWATERYCLFTRRGTKDWRGTVIHKPWILQNVEIIKLKDEFSKMIGTSEMELVSTSYSKELKVRFKQFERVSPPSLEATP